MRPQSRITWMQSHLSTPPVPAHIRPWELEVNSPVDGQFEQHLWGGVVMSATQNLCPPAPRDPSFAWGRDALNSEHQCYPMLKHGINCQSALPSFLLPLPPLLPHYTANHQQGQTEQVGSIPFLGNATSWGHPRAPGSLDGCLNQASFSEGKSPHCCTGRSLGFISEPLHSFQRQTAEDFPGEHGNPSLQGSVLALPSLLACQGWGPPGTITGWVLPLTPAAWGDKPIKVFTGNLSQMLSPISAGSGEQSFWTQAPGLC